MLSRFEQLLDWFEEYSEGIMGLTFLMLGGSMLILVLFLFAMAVTGNIEGSG